MGNITIVTEHINQLVIDEYLGVLSLTISPTYNQTAGINVAP